MHFLLREEDGSLTVQVPREDRSQIWNNFREGFWDYMPTHRKALLITGLAVTTVLFLLKRSSYKIITKDKSRILRHCNDTKGTDVV